MFCTCVLPVATDANQRRQTVRERERERAREDDGPNETLGERKNERQIISNSNNAIEIVLILI